MEDCFNNDIEIIGVSKLFPSFSKTFKQFQIQEIVCIPDIKPTASQLLSISVTCEILSTSINHTPKADSCEGQILTGNKLIVKGQLSQVIEYVADNTIQSIHTAHFTLPFFTYIILEDCALENREISVEGYIEDVFIKLIDKRKIFKNIMLLVNAATSNNI